MRWIALALTLMSASCAPVGEMIRNAGQPTAHTVSLTNPSIDQLQLEAYNGPKARVAVYQFTDRTAQGGVSPHPWYTPEIGSGMAEMLNDALLQSNRFIVLDRQGHTTCWTSRISRAAGGSVKRQALLLDRSREPSF